MKALCNLFCVLHLRANLSRALFLFVATFFSAIVAAKNYEPHKMWVSSWIGNGEVRFDSEADVQAAVKASFPYPVTRFFPVGSVTINSIPQGYSLDYTYKDGKTYTTSAYEHTTECVVGLDTVSTTPTGTNTTTIVCTDPAPEPPCDACPVEGIPPSAVGKPILPSTGLEQATETDYRGDGSNDLYFTRTYRSDRRAWAHNYQVSGVDLSPGVARQLSPSYPSYKGLGKYSKRPRQLRLVGTGQNRSFMLQRGNGRQINFSSAAGLVPPADVNDRVTEVASDGSGDGGYEVTNAATGATDRFDRAGKLVQTTARNGRVQTLIYSDALTPTSIAFHRDLLIRVQDDAGREIQFTYNEADEMVTMTDPGGLTYQYTYGGPSSVVRAQNVNVRNLTSVTFPDGKQRIYWYNEPAHTDNTDLPYHLTGITDENGARYATIKYNPAGLGVSTELAGGANKFSINYTNLFTQSIVTDPLGAARTYYFSRSNNVIRTTGVSQPGIAGAGGASASLRYDSNGNITQKNDFKGTVTNYQYDLTRNLETSRTEAAGMADARTITTSWHPQFRLPLVVTEPKRQTRYIYDGRGNQLTRTEFATNDLTGSSGASATTVGNGRTWTTAYNERGQITSVTGPRAGGTDQTRFSYDSSGNLVSITNPMNHQTLLSGYDAHGRVGRVQAPNGLVTHYEYTLRGWLKSVVVTGGGTSMTTSYIHDDVGQVRQINSPDGSTTYYTYDDAHRMTGVSDGAGNTIAYVLDAMGNRVSESVKDPSGTLALTVAREFDLLSRLKSVTGAAQ